MTTIPRPAADQALVDAVRRGAIDDVRASLQEGASPNTRDHDSGLTPLMLAAGMGAESIVRLLLASGALPNAVDERAGASALHKACQGGHLSCVTALVDGAALIDLQTTTTGHTPLIEAIAFTSDDIVEYLLDRNARIERTTYYGFSLDDHISYAMNVNSGSASLEKLRRIKQLVEMRRIRDAERQNSATLIKAVVAKDPDAVRAALEAGADVDERWPIVGSFDDGSTPLLIAARDTAEDGRIDIVQMLIDAGADVNAIEPVFGAVPLHKATYHGWVEATRALAAAPGIDLDYQGPSNGYTPLHDALWHGSGDCARVLIEAGARTDLVAHDGKLPVDIAAEELGDDHPVTRLLRESPR